MTLSSSRLLAVGATLLAPILADNWVALNPQQPTSCNTTDILFNTTKGVTVDVFSRVEFMDQNMAAFANSSMKWNFTITTPGYWWSNATGDVEDDYSSGDQPEQAKLNSTDFGFGTYALDNQTLTYSPGNNSKGSTLRAVVTDPSGKEEGGWDLNITVIGTYSCTATPLQSTCDDNSLQKNPKGWEQWDVDDFFWDYMRNVTGAAQDPATAKTWSPLQQLAQDFNIGTGAGAQCSYNKPCGDSGVTFACGDITPTVDGPYDAQVYLVFESLMNLSNFIYTMWQMVNTGAWNTDEVSDTLIAAFHPQPSTAKPWYQVLGQGTAIYSIASTFLGLIPGASDILAVPNAINSFASSLGAASGAAYQSTADLTVSYDKSFGQDLSNLQKMMETAFENFHSAIFDQGANVTHILSNGSFSDANALGINDDTIVQKGFNNFEQYLQLRLINDIWNEQNVFITYMPYTNDSDSSNVAWWDGKSTDGAGNDIRSFRKFSQSDCESQFSAADSDRVLCDTSDLGLTFLQPGMFRLNWYSDKVSGDGYNLNFNDRPPGWDANYIVNGTGYKFVMMDAMKSAIRTYDMSGFGFNAMSWYAEQAENTGNATAFNLMNTADPTAAGNFNFPICTSLDMTSWPTDKDSTATISGLCACNLDNSVDVWGNKFRDNVGDDLKKYIEKTSVDLSVEGCYAWNGDPNRSDFTDIRGQWTGPCNETCYPVWPPAPE